ncbi:MAG: ATP-binding cassette domain-containing protein [Nitrospinota bacterium]|nr:MAG: ATP-binding cassette domain-containing protein [Nitrospinota bacterium]
MTGTANAEPILVVEKLRKTYGQRVALKDISLSIFPGEFVVLLGPNGAGKTTLFNLITALFNPDAGRVLVNGYDTTRNPVAALASLGVVFQQQTLDLDLTVTQNLMFHAALQGMSRRMAKARIQEEAKRLGMQDRLKEQVRKLNGGHRRRVELMRALLHHPRFLLLDEPTAGLDIASRRLLHDHVRQLCRQEGVTVLWATHLLEEVNGVDRVLVLHKGSIVCEGTPEDMIRQTGAADLHEAFARLTPEGEEA